uniref:Protein phosphatase 2 regulatory subunit Balpha n=1 Tax=Felis catus TaxID=9685 RepID=A0ABI7ZEB0_FELCA
MGEDTDTRKINHSFLRDHSYVTEADIISTVEFNHTGELLATGDKGGRVVIFQREPERVGTDTHFTDEDTWRSRPASEQRPGIEIKTPAC